MTDVLGRGGEGRRNTSGSIDALKKRRCHMTAYLIVKASVAEADREAFDRWYQEKHLPDAVVAFNALGATRGWSEVEAGAHLAFYEFPTLQAANAIADSNAIKALIEEFDSTWEGRVTRTRDVVEIIQNIAAAE
jgi:hypothetical protein|tara:strand:- start:225 stop:626 length:402 start_codon:yes stop_codon:yes gene_type:complete